MDSGLTAFGCGLSTIEAIHPYALDWAISSLYNRSHQEVL